MPQRTQAEQKERDQLVARLDILARDIYAERGYVTSHAIAERAERELDLQGLRPRIPGLAQTLFRTDAWRNIGKVPLKNTKQHRVCAWEPVGSKCLIEALDVDTEDVAKPRPTLNVPAAPGALRVGDERKKHAALTLSHHQLETILRIPEKIREQEWWGDGDMRTYVFLRPEIARYAEQVLEPLAKVARARGVNW